MAAVLLPDGKMMLWCQAHSISLLRFLLSLGKSLCCGYYDGSLKIWDLKTTTLISSYSKYKLIFNPVFIASLVPSANQMSPVTCLKGLYTDSTLLLTGHEDGTAKLFALTDTKVRELSSCLPNFSHY